jgi:hypothetical protein
VLARSEGPGPRECDVDSESVSGKSLDNGSAATFAKVPIRDTPHPDDAVESPERNDGADLRELRKILELQVIPETDDRDDGEEDVENLERFVECVSDRAGSLK